MAGWLVAKLIVDVVFICTNLRRLRLGRLELALVFIIFFHLLLGFFALPLYDEKYSSIRALRDCLPVIIFFLKVAIFRRVFDTVTSASRDILWSVNPLLFLSVSQIIIFLILNRTGAAYAGITPPVSMVFAYAVATGATGLLVASSLTALLSGKRSIVLSFVTIYFLYAAKNFRTARLFAVLFATAGIVSLGVYFSWPIFDKISLSFEVFRLLSEDGFSGFAGQYSDGVAALSLSTAGRYDEWAALTAELNRISLAFGLGAGFTYDYVLVDGREFSGYSNAHFSPLSLTYKFGLIFCVVFYFYVLRHCFRTPARDAVLERWWRILTLVFIVQSLFAFNLFVEGMLPVAVAALLSLRIGQQRSRIAGSTSRAS